MTLVLTSDSALSFATAHLQEREREKQRITSSCTVYKTYENAFQIEDVQVHFEIAEQYILHSYKTHDNTSHSCKFNKSRLSLGCSQLDVQMW